MKKYFYMAMAAIAVLSSCSNDNEFEPNQIGALVFTATMEGSEGSRATYDSGTKCASWEAGDQISINGKTYSAQTAGTTTTFKAATEGQEAEGYFQAFFPASLFNGTTTTLPANINEAYGKFNMPMYASSDNTTLAFTNLCGVLKISVNAGELDGDVKSITISSTNKGISGEFELVRPQNENAYHVALKDNYKNNPANTLTVNYTYPEIGTGGEHEDDLTPAISIGIGISIGTPLPKVFYVAIPPETYENLSIAISDGTKTRVMTTKKDQDITVARSKIYSINFQGQPTTGEAQITDDSNVKWVQLWAGGPMFAEHDLGANDDTGIGSSLSYTEATTNISSWGTDWCIPSKEQMEELVKAGQGNSSSKVTCSITQEKGVWGFKFTGKGAYASNSVFFPWYNEYCAENRCWAYYWLVDGSEELMELYYDSGWQSKWATTSQYSEQTFRVRPVRSK